MSIEHQIYLATDESAEEVAVKVCRLFVTKGLSAAQPSIDEMLDVGGASTDLGMMVSVSSPPPSRFDVADESFGVVEKVMIWVEPNPTRSIVRQDDDLVALVAGLMEETAADLAVTYNHETALLIRRGGELILHEDCALWPEHRLALIKAPYRRESHSF